MKWKGRRAGARGARRAWREFRATGRRDRRGSESLETRRPSSADARIAESGNRRTLASTRSNRGERSKSSPVEYVPNKNVRSPEEKGKDLRERQHDARSVSILVSDFSVFQVTEQALWHFTRMFSSVSLPRMQPDRASARVDQDGGPKYGAQGEDHVKVLEVSLFSNGSPSIASHSGGDVTASSLRPGTTNASFGGEFRSENHMSKPDSNARVPAEPARLANSSLEPVSRARITPETELAFIYQRYNIVIAIDISPSMLNTIATRQSQGYRGKIENQNLERLAIMNSVVDEEVRSILECLSEPMLLNCSTSGGAPPQSFRPEIFLSVVAVGALDEPFRPLIKSFPLVSTSFKSKSRSRLTERNSGG